ncbi:MAG: PIN domain-containing protein [Lewinellaceae bacterium]|nr:PIN domain-containing protein [Phaeodactylibacter sp.]MCB9035456.1 PIN domain-containing protein [Lewinellaceae bacterium]
MSKKIFLDSDVVIDFLMKREPFEVESMKIFEYSLRNQLTIGLSSLSISNIYYIIRRVEDKKKAIDKVRSIIKLTEILSVDKSMVEKSAYSEFKDFEDGIQYFCADFHGYKTIITRNVKDYSKSSLSVLTPKEFLANFEK